MSCEGKRYWARLLPCAGWQGLEQQIVCGGDNVFFGVEANLVAGAEGECCVCFREVFSSTSVRDCEYTVCSPYRVPPLCEVPATCADFGYVTDAGMADCSDAEEAVEVTLAAGTVAGGIPYNEARVAGELTCYDCRPICSWRIIETAYNVTYESGGPGTSPPSSWTPPSYSYPGYMELQTNCGGGEWTTQQQWTTQDGGPTQNF